MNSFCTRVCFYKGTLYRPQDTAPTSLVKDCDHFQPIDGQPEVVLSVDEVVPPEPETPDVSVNMEDDTNRVIGIVNIKNPERTIIGIYGGIEAPKGNAGAKWIITPPDAPKAKFFNQSVWNLLREGDVPDERDV